jgi:hypothetical protein
LYSASAPFEEGGSARPNAESITVPPVAGSAACISFGLEADPELGRRRKCGEVETNSTKSTTSLTDRNALFDWSALQYGMREALGVPTDVVVKAG